MKAVGEEYSVTMPPGLAAEIEARAHEEHRTADELVLRRREALSG
jgi:hypothetical protein